VENGIILLTDRVPEPFTVTGHLDHFVRQLRIEYVPAIDKLYHTIQVSQMRGQFLRGAVDHLVYDRFGQGCARPPRILQNEDLNPAFARLLGTLLKHNFPNECPAANETGRLPEWQSLRDVRRITNDHSKLWELPAAEVVKGYDSRVEPQVVSVKVSSQSMNDTNEYIRTFEGPESPTSG